MASLDDILSGIEAKTGISKDELRSKVEKKQKDLSGMISAEGAAHLVAKEMGVNMLSSEKRKIELKNIVPGMRNVSAAGRVFKVSNIVDFKKGNGTPGRVVNIFIGDRSGFVRMPLWNEHVEMIENEEIKLGDIVQVTGAFANENIYGDVEISIGKYGKIFNINDEASGSEIEFPTVDELSVFLSQKSGQVPIKNISTGSFEIKGTVIDVVKSRFVFDTCPKCRSKVSISYGKYSCAQHGEVENKPEMVVSFVVDDGTGLLRVVAFREVAEKLVGMKADEIVRMSEEERYEKLIGTMVGKEYIIFGSVKKGRTDELEMVASNAEAVDVSKESEKLADMLKLKLG